MNINRITWSDPDHTTMGIVFLNLLLSLIFCCPSAFGQTGINSYEIKTNSFKLSRSSKNIFIVTPLKEKINIPREWLYPPKEVEKDINLYVSSFNYSESVTSFVVDESLLGLHLSSWDSMPPGTGSAMAGAGRDIFLLYDKNKKQITPGLLSNEITKSRLRSMGCFFSTQHDYKIGDVNNDGVTDIGVTKRKIWCDEKSDKEHRADFFSGPYYKIFPVEWYIFKQNGFYRDAKYYGGRSRKATQPLPLIDLKMSPVDFILKSYHYNGLPCCAPALIRLNNSHR